MTAVSAILFGAGQRGGEVYSAYALRNPERLRICAVAEPVAERRESIAAAHELSADEVRPDWRDLLAAPRKADAVIVATGDMQHALPALAALEAGYHVLLEKPMAPSESECRQLVAAAERTGRILQIAHVLRYTGFYTRVAQLLHEGRIGKLLTLDMKEHIAHWHMSHSYVRGKFRNRSIAAPIILAKSCHDLDLIAWLVGRPALRLASFGNLVHYTRDAAPVGAPERCTDGCPVQASCPHDAVRFYADPPDSLAGIWPWRDVSRDPSAAARLQALRTGPYGRCVHRCDNDVPDHQLTTLEFEGGALASFTLQGHATHETRTIRASGSLGELRGILQEGLIELTLHGGLETEQIVVPGSAADHYGGDAGLLDHFCEVVSRGDPGASRTSAAGALESHLLGFAAECAREQGRVVDLSREADA
jgi:predicted dehydrogenase